jgi:hypothetical protein
MADGNDYQRNCIKHMKTYQISIPAFSLTISAKNQREAMEQFWFDYDCVQGDPDWGEPHIKLIKKRHGQSNA